MESVNTTYLPLRSFTDLSVVENQQRSNPTSSTDSTIAAASNNTIVKHLQASGSSTTSTIPMGSTTETTKDKSLTDSARLRTSSTDSTSSAHLNIAAFLGQNSTDSKSSTQSAPRNITIVKPLQASESSTDSTRSRTSSTNSPIAAAIKIENLSTKHIPVSKPTFKPENPTPEDKTTLVILETELKETLSYYQGILGIEIKGVETIHYVNNHMTTKWQERKGVHTICTFNIAGGFMKNGNPDKQTKAAIDYIVARVIAAQVTETECTKMENLFADNGFLDMNRQLQAGIQAEMEKDAKPKAVIQRSPEEGREETDRDIQFTNRMTQKLLTFNEIYRHALTPSLEMQAIKLSLAAIMTFIAQHHRNFSKLGDAGYDWGSLSGLERKIGLETARFVLLDDSPIDITKAPTIRLQDLPNYVANTQDTDEKKLEISQLSNFAFLNALIEVVDNMPERASTLCRIWHRAACVMPLKGTMQDFETRTIHLAQEESDKLFAYAVILGWHKTRMHGDVEVCPFTQQDISILRRFSLGLKSSIDIKEDLRDKTEFIGNSLSITPSPDLYAWNKKHLVRFGEDIQSVIIFYLKHHVEQLKLFDGKTLQKMRNIAKIIEHEFCIIHYTAKSEKTKFKMNEHLSVFSLCKIGEARVTFLPPRTIKELGYSEGELETVYATTEDAEGLYQRMANCIINGLVATIRSPEFIAKAEYLNVNRTRHEPTTTPQAEVTTNRFRSLLNRIFRSR